MRYGAKFVKIVSKFDKKNEWVQVTCIGIQSAGNFSTNVAQGVDHALITYDSDDNITMLYGQGINVGGGGTRKDLVNKVNRCARENNYDEYMYTTCSLHGLNLTLSSPTNLIMGDSA